ncbi:hypothetical protein LC593_05835 [Nostoc sp. CHAB 5844]|nr:hypothetical protein [Nostoc sp. CHAB 5844]
MTVGKADDTCFHALNPRNAVSPQRTAHRNALARLEVTVVGSADLKQLPC